MAPKAAKNVDKRVSMVCLECGYKFKKAINTKIYEVQCPKCKGYDTEPD